MLVVNVKQSKENTLKFKQDTTQRATAIPLSVNE